MNSKYVVRRWNEVSMLRIMTPNARRKLTMSTRNRGTANDRHFQRLETIKHGGAAANKYCSLPKSHEHTADSYPGDNGRDANRPEAIQPVCCYSNCFSCPVDDRTFLLGRCRRPSRKSETFRWKIDFRWPVVPARVWPGWFYNFYSVNTARNVCCVTYLYTAI